MSGDAIMDALGVVALSVVALGVWFSIGFLFFSGRLFGRVSGVSSVEIVVRFSTGTTASDPSKALADIHEMLNVGLQKDCFAAPLNRDQKAAVFYYEILSITVDRT